MSTPIGRRSRVVLEGGPTRYETGLGPSFRYAELGRDLPVGTALDVRQAERITLLDGERIDETDQPLLAPVGVESCSAPDSPDGDCCSAVARNRSSAWRRRSNRRTASTARRWAIMPRYAFKEPRARSTRSGNSVRKQNTSLVASRAVSSSPAHQLGEPVDERRVRVVEHAERLIVTRDQAVEQ